MNNPLPALRGETVPKPPQKRRTQKAAKAEAGFTEAPATPTDDGWRDTPSVANQFTAERWKHTCRQCPTEMHYFVIPADLEKFNALQHEFLPVSAPRRIMLSSREPDFCPTDGQYRMLVLTAKIQYRKLLQDIKPDLPAP